LAARALPARLVHRSGDVVTVGGWPADEPVPDPGRPNLGAAV